MKKVAFIDFETTDLNPKKGFVTEVAIIQMSYCEKEGKLPKVLKQYTSFNDPGVRISSFIAKLTGIDNNLVKGHKINWKTVNHILDESDIIVAHNAPFDYSWARHHGKCKESKWLCSVSMVSWKSHGFKNSKLETLKKAHDIDAPSHRAIDDVRTLIKILKQKDKKGNTYFSELLENSKTELVDIILSKTKFKDKDIIKSLGFYWKPVSKTWQYTTTESKLSDMLEEIRNKLPNVKALVIGSKEVK